VATSSRATLGGMIANDSSGAHTAVYGTTGQHINELELVLCDARSRASARISNRCIINGRLLMICSHSTRCKSPNNSRREF